MSVYLALLGAPVSGKGTQTDILSRYIPDLFRFSTGDIIRSEIKKGTVLGKNVSSYLSEGKLVPDSVIVKLFEKSITHDVLNSGIISDGFPRTKAQALSFLNVFLNKKCPVVILSFDINLDQLMGRLLGRRICPNCNSVYHVDTKPPLLSGICDYCDHVELVKRDDDNELSINVRFNEYQKEIQPIKEVLAPYIVSIDASLDTVAVSDVVKEKLAMYLKTTNE